MAEPTLADLQLLRARQSAPTLSQLELLRAAAKEKEEAQKAVSSAPLARDLPEISDSDAFNRFSLESALGTLGVMSAAGEDEKAAILREQLGAEIFEDAEGRLIASFPDGQYAINKPGLSRRDVMDTLFRFLAFVPSGRVASIGNTAGKKMAANAIQGVVQGGATEAGLQAIEGALGGSFDGGEIVTEGLLNGIGQLGSDLIAGRLKKMASERAGRALGLGDTDADTALGALGELDNSLETTRELTRAQKLNDPFLLEEQSFVAQLPEGARPAIQKLIKLNRAAANDVKGFLDRFGSIESVVVGPKRVRTAAQKAIELKKLARSEASAYKQAFASFTGEVDVAPVLEHIEGQLKRFPERHPAHAALRSFAKDIQENAGSLEKLQGVKEVVDLDIAAKAPASLSTKQGSAINKAHRELAEAESLLLYQMDIASPEFRQARLDFAKNSGPIDELRNSLVGVVADVKDTKLRSIANTIFNPAETNPEVVRSAARAIRSADPGAWDEVIRLELERRLGSVRSLGEELSTIQGQEIANVPSELRRALFPNKKSRDVLFAAMDDTQRTSAIMLENALRRAARGRPGGSQTGVRREISERFEKGLVGAIRRFISSPIETTAQIGADSARSRRIRAVAEAHFSSDWAPEITRIRQLAGDQTDRYMRLFQDVAASLRPESVAVVQVAGNRQDDSADE